MQFRNHSNSSAKLEYVTSTYASEINTKGHPILECWAIWIELADNYPFGEQWFKTGGAGNEHRFTGHLRDTESGNEYAGARYYSNVRGRWLSVDPVLGNLADPQRLNRYSYVLNDPVNLTDPDGQDPQLRIRVQVWGDYPPYGWGPGKGATQVQSPIRGDMIDLRIDIRAHISEVGAALQTPQFSGRLARSKRSLKQRLKLSDPDCLGIFSTLGVDPAAYLAKLDEIDFRDGTTSTDLVSSVINEPWANAKGVSGWTIGQLFKDNFPDQSGTAILGFTPPEGTTVYLYGIGFSGDGIRPYQGVSPETIAHELFHKFKLNDFHLLDPKNDFGLDPLGPSSQFSDYFEDKCL